MTTTSPNSPSRRFTLPRIFVALGFLSGLVMLFLTPPFCVPDEPHHLMRAYQVSEGTFLPIFKHNFGGDMLPINIEAVSMLFSFDQRFNSPFNSEKMSHVYHVPVFPDQRKYMEFSNTSAYSP